MPDICLCLNEECPSRKQCYRYMAVPFEMYQPYGDFKPDETGKCNSFEPIEGRRVRK